MVTASELRRIGQGREAEIFLWGDGAVLKLYRHEAYVQSRAHEAAAMNAAKSAGAPAPGALDFVEVDGRPGLVMERVEGIDLLTAFGNKPWTVFAMSRAMGVAHAQLHAVQAPAELPRIKEAAAHRMRTSPLIPEALRAVGVAALERLPQGDRLCHGDFHPGNVIINDSVVRVIDWPNAFAGDPDADVTRTLLTLRIGDPPAGTTPAAMRALIGVGRRIMISFYQRGYRSVRPFDARRVERDWMLPVAIYRLQDDIEDERPKLLKLIEQLRTT